MTTPIANMNRRNPATLCRVIDGDTVELAIDLGHKIAVRATVRLAGINTAERGTPAGDAAKAATELWFAENGSTVIVETAKGDDKFGRYLATITTRHGDDLAADLIQAGHAVRWNGRGAKPEPAA